MEKLTSKFYGDTSRFCITREFDGSYSVRDAEVCIDGISQQVGVYTSLELAINSLDLRV